MSFIIKQIVEGFLGFFVNIFREWKMIAEVKNAGREEAKNAAHEENAKRKEKADEVLASPIKTGNSLIDSLRDRNNFDDN
jgi:hypothetical protein